MGMEKKRQIDVFRGKLNMDIINICFVVSSLCVCMVIINQIIIS